MGMIDYVRKTRCGWVVVGKLGLRVYKWETRREAVRKYRLEFRKEMIYRLREILAL